MCDKVKVKFKAINITSPSIFKDPKGSGVFFIAMKEFAKAFYKSQAWKDCRESYLKSVGYKCENCMARGIETPAVIVHHIEELTPMNIHRPEVTMNFENLRAVCRKCHADEHMNCSSARCYFFGENGEIILKKRRR